jgi:hypothetical protein
MIHTRKTRQRDADSTGIFFGFDEDLMGRAGQAGAPAPGTDWPVNIICETSMNGPLKSDGFIWIFTSYAQLKN